MIITQDASRWQKIAGIPDSGGFFVMPYKGGAVDNIVGLFTAKRN